jgi:hypothetical protein
MAEPLLKSTFRDLSGEVDDALNVLARYGLTFPPGRFNQGRRDIDELARLHESGSLAEAARDRTSHRLLASLFDINDISHIYRSLLFLEGHGMEERVRAFVARPDDSVIDTRYEGEDGRDLAFELSMLARLVAAGLPVQIEQNADLKVQIEKQTVFVRCLRLRTASQVGTRIRDAWRSLDSSCQAVENGRSILALSVSKLEGFELNVLLAPDETRLRRLLAKPVQTFHTRYQHTWQHSPSDAMAGVFVFFARPVLISLTERLVYSQELSFSTAHGAREADPEMLDTMLDRFDYLNALTAFS